MKRGVLLLLGVLAISARAEQLAAPVFSPMGKPMQGECTLFVDVTEYPQPGKFYLQYRITSQDLPVELKIGALRRAFPPNTDHRDGFGEVFGFGLQPEGEAIVLTAPGGRQCNGSPFSVKEFANRRALQHLYGTLFGRLPEDKEYVAWLDLPEEERRQRALDLLDSPERKKAIIQAYLEQLLPSQTGVIDAAELANSGRSVEDVIADFLSSEVFYHTQGGGTPEGYLMALYTNTLGQSVGVEEHRQLLQYLAQGSSLREVAQYILRKPEFRQGMIHYWWAQHLHRQPTDVEVREAINALDRGWDWSKLQAGVIASDEYYKRSVLNRN